MNATNCIALVALGMLLIQGCATKPEREATPQTEISQKSEPVETIPVRPFTAETLYALLVAEIAGGRERYDIALGNYIQQAHKTRDPGIAARATRIARFLNVHQATLSTGLLWTQLEPENTEARLIVATELAQAGRYQDAFKHSRHLLKSNSTPIFQHIAAHAAKASDSERKHLLDEYNQLLVSHPENLQLLVGKALLLQQQNKLEESLAIIRQVLEHEESHIPAAVLEAKLLNQMKQPEKALERLVELLNNNPGNAPLRLQYARLLASYDLKKAHEQFKLLVAQSPQDPELIFSLALISNELGLKKEAISQFKRLLALGHRKSSANYYLGRIEEERDNLDEALDYYDKVAPGPDYLPALVQYSDILIRQNKNKKAHARLNKLRSRFPSQSEHLYLLESEVLSRNKQLDEAVEVLSKGLGKHPANSKLLYARAMINERRDFISHVEDDLREIIRQEPNNATALNALGYTLADRTDRYEEAYELISQALSLKPDDPAIIDSMGWVQYRMGNYEEALLRLREAMKAFPDDEIAAHLGEVLWATGNKEEARSVWKKGMRLNPASSTIPATIERLESLSKRGKR